MRGGTVPCTIKPRNPDGTYGDAVDCTIENIEAKQDEVNPTRELTEQQLKALQSFKMR